MLGVQIENAFDGGLPGRKCLFGQALDQVKIQIIETSFAR